MLEVRDFKKRAKEGEIGRVLKRLAMCHYCDRSASRRVLRHPAPHPHSRIQMALLSNLKKKHDSFVHSVCNKMTKNSVGNPFLCMDMTYITCLLKDGFGFKENTMLQVRQRYTIL